ncbi:hypothetical protein Tco_1557238, partial [Tanacetum coccineum]
MANDETKYEIPKPRCEHEECLGRIHASLMQDKVTFEVRNLVETHTCTRSNMGGNKHATQGWIASVVTDKIKSDGDINDVELRKWLMKHYNVNIPLFYGASPILGFPNISFATVSSRSGSLVGQGSACNHVCGREYPSPVRVCPR